MPRLALVLGLLCVLAGASTASADPWLDRTLQFQSDLADRVPLRNAPWLGTHNSFNTRAETPTLSGLDANQTLSMAAQLDAGMRSLEIDVHTFPSPWAGGQPAPVVCHARSQAELNAGCSTERLLDARLAEIKAWLDAHPREIVLLYIEDHFDGVAGADGAAQMLDAVLGPKIYRPATACAPLPLDLSRNKIRKAGKQVLVVSGCAEGAAWGSLVFDDAERAANETGAEGYEPYPACDADPARDEAFHLAHFVRVFEDSTVLSAAVGVTDPPARITANRMRSLVACGVDLVGLDQLTVADDRLEAAAWSWAPGEPSAPGCVAMRVKDGHWQSASCKGQGRFACRTRGGSLTVGARDPYRRSRRGCAGARFGLPRTGLENAQLRAAMERARVDQIWLNYRTR